MTSIRQRLFIWLLIGLSILWAIAGIGVYLAVKQTELAKLDSELSRMEGSLRFIAMMSQRTRGPVRPDHLITRPARDNFQSEENRENRENRENNITRISQNWNDFIGDNPPHYMIWSEQGNIIKKSEAINDKHFLFPKNIEDFSTPIFYSFFHQGENYRAVTFKFRRFRGRPRTRGPDRINISDVDPNIQSQEESPPRSNNLVGAISINTQAMNQTLNFLLLAIIAVGIIAGFFSFLLVQLALKNGLKPLNILGNNLASVNPSSLSHRFSKKDLPKELSPIADHLNQLMARLESGFIRERQFSSDLAHELRTPIAELKMMSEVALRWPEKNDENYVEETLDIARQLHETMETLLNLNRFENGQEELKLEDVCVKTTLIEGLDKYEDQIKRKNIKVNLEIPKGMTIHTDPGIFRTIIHNLLSNCAEYTPANGSITIKANNNSIDNVLCISNSVENMTAEMVPNLFERFWRADDSRSDSSHIGLGLSLTRACANALSLGLDVELSEDNKSIHFTLSYQDKEIFKPSSSGNV